MSDNQENETLLGGHRVLDLANERGSFCGKILGDFGADVIKIESPGGDPSRNIGPFYKDIPHPEKSLFWFALNTNKRGITLNIETADGREIFRKLVKTADFVIESFEPGYLDKLGLGYAELEKINRRTIMVSITPFGATGPYAHYKGSDAVVWAMSAFMGQCGEMDKSPCRVSVPQSFFAGALHAAMGAMLAHYHREATGEGQHVDASMQEAMMPFLMGAVEVYDLHKINRERAGAFRSVPRSKELGPLNVRQFYPCKDGQISLILRGTSRSSKALEEMADEVGLGAELKAYDRGAFEPAKISQKDTDHYDDILIRFFLTRTKKELYEAAFRKEILLAPVNTVKDLVEDSQLAAREYFVKVDHPELGDTITYPGVPVKMSEAPCKISRRAPLIGEHNEEIYVNELGLSKEQLTTLKAIGAI